MRKEIDSKEARGERKQVKMVGEKGMDQGSRQ